MKTAFKLLGILLALAFLAGVMAYLTGFFEPKIPVDEPEARPAAETFREFTVKVIDAPVIEEAAGTLRAKVETVISPLITAAISSITVWPGDEVKKGDMLVRLDSRELKARVDQVHQAVVASKANLEQVRKDVGRVRRIARADRGAVSRAEIDRLEAALSAAEANLSRLKRQKDEAGTALSYSKLTAPISGRIVGRYGDPGDTARRGEPLLRMYDPNTLRLEANVRESVASKLAKGRSLFADIDAVNRRYPVVVDEIVPTADPGSRSFLVKATLKDGAGLYPGMFGRLLIPIARTEKILIPDEAVTRVGQLDFVMTASDRGPVRRYVRVGERQADGQVQVISGLAPGETVLIAEQ
ncbi:MAG: efflux RND transporter periplasmic adaptor subunit [Deltaproteobacteria bacterium]|nr:efflux RND transporter periplasmic adaptor subunit [Deltaproteobacteria bacterium]